MLSQIFHFNKVFLAAVLQNLSNSLETLLETFRIQMCWRQLLCFWAFKSCWRENYLFDALSLQLRPSPAEARAKNEENEKKSKKRQKGFSLLLLIIAFSQAKDDCPKELLSSERALPNKRGYCCNH